MKTLSAKSNEIERKWYLIDAKDQVLGKVATTAASILRGKDKALFTPHIDCGDYLVVINADKVVLTGRKEERKTYTSYSGYAGGQKTETVAQVRERKPELIVERAIRGMIPHNRLGRAIYRKLSVYNGEEHPHAAQHPTPVEVH